MCKISKNNTTFDINLWKILAWFYSQFWHLLPGFFTRTIRKSDEMLAFSSLLLNFSSLSSFSHFFFLACEEKTDMWGKKKTHGLHRQLIGILNINIYNIVEKRQNKVIVIHIHGVHLNRKVPAETQPLVQIQVKSKGLSKKHVAKNVGMKCTRFSALAKTLISSK